MSLGPWQPLWLGVAQRQLYAALHRPAVLEPVRGVLLVPPLLHEQPRSRRFIAEVASAFAAQGVAALRFDYFGSGDSAGRSDELLLSTMQEDLHVAAGALRAQAGVSSVAVMAWRASALVVWDWLRHGGTASELILWEPIVDGDEWLADLVRADAIERCSPSRYTAQRHRIVDASDDHLMGYAATQAMRDAMAGVSITLATTPAAPVWLIERTDKLDSCSTRIAAARTVALPVDAPQFGDSTHMDESLFMTPRMDQVANELALALSGGG